MPLNISEGNRVEITLDKEDKSTAFSIVGKICEDDLVMIHMPVSSGSLVELPIYADYKMIFYTERGLLRYDTKIIKYTSEGNLRFILIKICSEPEKLQRREFFRFECDIEFKFEKSDESGEEFDGFIKDISAGGMRFDTNEAFSVGDILKCRINLNGNEIISSAKIIHIEKNVKANYKFQYGAKFLSTITF